MALQAPVPHLSVDLCAYLNALIEKCSRDQNRTHFIPHIQKGLDQIQMYLQAHYSSDNGQPYPTFAQAILRDSSLWERHLKNARNDSETVKVYERIIPTSALDDITLKAYDIKVGLPGRPDDIIYKKSEYARKFFPRGNYIGEYISSDEKPLYFPLLRGYLKFTGQEDENETTIMESEEVLNKYFTRPKAEASHVIISSKENGEAAHLRVLKTMGGKYLYVLGSKSTHVIVESLEDFMELQMLAKKKNQNSTYAAATTLGGALLEKILQLESNLKDVFCEFMWQSCLTASFEVLNPQFQHVQSLDHLDSITPVFYGWTLPYIDENKGNFGAEVCVNPILGLVFMQHIGFQVVDYKIVQNTIDALQSAQMCIRNAYQNEGAVCLYLDENYGVIGMQKFKSAWYICLRAIREKAKAYLRALQVHAKNAQKAKSSTEKPQSRYEADILNIFNQFSEQMQMRFEGIEEDFGISPKVSIKYKTLGINFFSYLYDEKLTSHYTTQQVQWLKKQVAENFPVVWKEFLSASCKDDHIISH